MEPTLDRSDGALLRCLAIALIFVIAAPQAALAVDTSKRARFVCPSTMPGSSFFGPARELVVLSIDPREIVVKSPMTSFLRVNFQTCAPNRKVKATVLFDGGQSGMRFDCGTHVLPGRRVCEIKLRSIRSETTWAKVYLYSEKLEAREHAFETAVIFDVPVTFAPTKMPVHRSGNGALPQTNPSNAPQRSGAGRTQALNPQPIPPLGDRNALNPQPIPPRVPAVGGPTALNPQPIPPGPSSRIPIRNPGDPAPLTREGGAQQ